MTIKEIQNALLSLGYKIGKVDGILGPKTTKAVRAFQTKTKYLKIDGIPGPKTSAALQKAVQPANVYPMPIISPQNKERTPTGSMGGNDGTLSVLQSGSGNEGPRSPVVIPDEPARPTQGGGSVQSPNGSSLPGVQQSTGKPHVSDNEGSNGVPSGSASQEGRGAPKNQVFIADSGTTIKPPPGATSGLSVASREQIGNVNRPDPVRNAPQWAIALYESLGWSHIQAVALTANLIWESGGNRHTPMTIKFDAVGDAGHSHGAGQWNDMPNVQRFQGLQAFATRRGRSWGDAETQLLWLDTELATTERRAGALLRAATTIEDAIAACIKIWRPSIPHTEKRLAIARKLLNG
jgi:peptidoglycan hydrolase-like protein with peptidoglycan-binding domain